MKAIAITAAFAFLVGLAVGWQTHAWKVGADENEDRKESAEVAGETNRKESAELNSNQEKAYALDDAIRNSDTDDDGVFRCLWLAIREGRATARCVPESLPAAAEAKPPAKPQP